MPRPHRPPTHIAPHLLLAAGLACAIALASAGCGGDHGVAPKPAPRLPVGTPGNTAPDSTVLRLMTAYMYMAPGEYDTLLAADFRYRFSTQTDPALVSLYGDGWGKFDEATSFGHLVHGFTNSQGVYVPKASSIVASVLNAVVADDTAHVDSTTWYRSVTVMPLNINIDVAAADGTTTYNISSTIKFLLVRGDAAVLGAGQDHSAARWYVREMDDFTTTPFSKGPVTMPASATSWGMVRAFYR